MRQSFGRMCGAGRRIVMFEKKLRSVGIRTISRACRPELPSNLRDIPIKSWFNIQRSKRQRSNTGGHSTTGCSWRIDHSDRDGRNLVDLQAGKYLESDVGRADRKCMFFPAALCGALLWIKSWNLFLLWDVGSWPQLDRQLVVFSAYDTFWNADCLCPSEKSGRNGEIINDDDYRSECDHNGQGHRDRANGY